MAYVGSAQGSGRATAGAVTPVRAAAADRKAPDPLNPEESAPRENKPAGSAETDSKRTTDRETPKQPASDPHAEAAARRAAQNSPADTGPEPLTPPEKRAEDIKALKKLESQALYSGPPTIRERAVAQLAHAFLIREEAALRAHELEESWKESQRQDAARFLAAQAAAAYRQLDGFSGAPSDAALIH
ncbi:hypothetical protein [Hyphococcus luteus]|uniref:Uncharacterized protein n=1 Tax=Hyphococcus luteus TaxID=2058213 RepID=A0A2S7K4P5_9PROT|nr:hypothetical protein [Marinicaulis flavus]PQA87446.1 hypothetical protein CW354_11615 [Marinicaulis flavus]